MSAASHELTNAALADATLRAYWQSGQVFELAVDGAGTRSVFARVEGQACGPWITLLHGFPGSSWDFHRVVPLLERRFRMLSFDFLGYGASEKGKHIAHSTALNANTATALWDRLGVEATVVAGHDIGTAVLQELLARQQESKRAPRIRGALFSNGMVINDRFTPSTLQRLLLSRFGGLVSRALSERPFAARLREATGTSCLLSAADYSTLWKAFSREGGHRHAHRLVHHLRERRINKARWEGVLNTATLPVRFVWGREDPFANFVADDIRRRIPGAIVRELPQVGHFPPLEASEQFAASLEELAGGNDEIRSPE
jgi:pimeloyl-ACP methyl ester carboxylesterase